MDDDERTVDTIEPVGVYTINTALYELAEHVDAVCLLVGEECRSSIIAGVVAHLLQGRP